MPELPEVETTRRGITPHLMGRKVARVEIRQARLRWPVSEELATQLPGRRIEHITRRGKYLLLGTAIGSVIIHLGMSGSLRVLKRPTPPGKHDHVDIILTNAVCLRLRDPRRFGAVLWTTGPPEMHPLLANLGLEPWDPSLNGAFLWKCARGRRLAVKNLIMDSRVVVGVGNIYANEALFAAGIHPNRPAGRISSQRYQRLTDRIRTVLEQAIEQGGTTLRDFVDSSGRAGYFAQQLTVYQRGGEPCTECAAPIKTLRIGQRSSFYCPRCQR